MLRGDNIMTRLANNNEYMANVDRRRVRISIMSRCASRGANMARINASNVKADR